jgi:hypothetical protein
MIHHHSSQIFPKGFKAGEFMAGSLEHVGAK